jgi:hypothetical protein
MKKFNTLNEVRSHINSVSISPEYTYIIPIIVGVISGLILSLITTVIVKLVSEIFIENLDGLYLIGTALLTFILYSILTSLAIILPGRVDLPVGYVGIIQILGKPRFEEYYYEGDLCLLTNGKHWVVPRFMGVLQVKVQEQSVVVTKAIGKVRIDEDTKSSNKSFQDATFVDISFGNIRVNLAISDPFAFAIHTGNEMFEKELESTIGEAIRDFAINGENKSKDKITTSNIYDADVNLYILEKIRESKHTNPDGTEEYNTARWGVFIISINIPDINPDSEDVRIALEGGYKEILDRIKEKAESSTLIEIFSDLQKKDPDADSAFLWSVAMRLVKDLTKPGRDFFVQGGSADSVLFGVAGAAINQQSTNSKPKEQ